MGKTDRFTFETMLSAAKTCDASYDGKFWLGVLSTKIYCLPSCKARFPLEKNVIFFSTREEAVRNDFRGCMRCKSEFYPYVEPQWLDKIKKYMCNNLTKKITEKEGLTVIKTTIKKKVSRIEEIMV